MATIDITASMQPSRYDDEPDRWTSRIGYLAAADPQAIELRMRCNYTQRTERFTVLYQGPGGGMRIEHGGPDVPGPIGALIAQASVISASPMAPVRTLDVEAGDVLIIHGQRMVILDDRPHDYPRLVSEVEVGLIAAVAVIRARIVREHGVPSGTVQDNAIHIAKVALLTEISRSIADLAPVLRVNYVTER